MLYAFLESRHWKCGSEVKLNIDVYTKMKTTSCTVEKHEERIIIGDYWNNPEIVPIVASTLNIVKVDIKKSTIIDKAILATACVICLKLVKLHGTSGLQPHYKV